MSNTTEKLCAELLVVQECLAGAHVQLGEMEAEHLAETTLFGDSWPGAQVEIANVRRECADLLQRQEWILGALGFFR